MPHFPRMTLLTAALACANAALIACGGMEEGSVTVTVTGPNAVSQWNEIATNTINLPATATGTPEEQRPNTTVDLATVHVAIYDAVMAITGTHLPYAITPTAAAADASQEAAVAAAAHRVLLGLFPSRSASYQAAYDSFVAALPNNVAKSQGLALGAEVAAGILALRANDGRSVALAAYVPGSGPGQFRGLNPVGRPNAFIKPFVLSSPAQFRAPGPAALGSAEYAADLNETKALASAASSVRTAAQTEIARFHTQPPPTFWPNNMRALAMTGRSLAEHARLLAMVFVAQADAQNACFDSKYHYQFWRPTSAIALADTDGNDSTTADATWTPVVATPNHPEYPAAHGCVAGATAQVMRNYYQTQNVTFDMSSTVTGTTHHFTTLDAFVVEIQLARVAGGMHFRKSAVDGTALGKNVADWMLANRFQAR